VSLSGLGADSTAFIVTELSSTDNVKKKRKS